ncbi:hypothetical protein BC332_30386 [Capsicum chinense]|nr:hypothetical protein BC332_30386 [Capsicum chinense]
MSLREHSRRRYKFLLAHKGAYNSTSKTTAAAVTPGAKIIYIASRLESEDVPTNSGEPAISLYAITRKQHVDAMQLQAVIDKKLLLSLVGSGSTHNFISSTAAQRLDLPIQRRRNLYASVANGEKISSLGIWMVVQFSVANHSFNVDLYVIPLDAFDIVLGLPTRRSCDHRICLLPGTDPVADAPARHYSTQSFPILITYTAGLKT